MNINKSFENLDLFLSGGRISCQKNYSLQTNSYSKTGRIVKRLIVPFDELQLIAVVRFLRASHFEFITVGETSNIIFLDSVAYSIFVTTKMLTQYSITDCGNKVYVEAGKSLPDFVREGVMRSITGYEGLEGIPGSIGGALLMNAGAYSYTISDNLISVRYLNGDGEIVDVEKSKLNFTARSSVFKGNSDLIIIGATFKLQKGKPEEIANKVETYHIARHLYQEWVYPNLGSSFTLDKSIYDDLALNKENKIFSIKLKIIKKLFFNKLLRSFRRKKPSNKLLNDLVTREFGLGEFDNFYSHKNLNTFVNKNYSTNQILSYLLTVSNKLSSKAIVENELILKSIYKVNKSEDYRDAKLMYDQILEKKHIEE